MHRWGEQRFRTDSIYDGSLDQLPLDHVLRGAWLQAELKSSRKHVPSNRREACHIRPMAIKR